jgi:hypothetical protein
MVTVSQGDANFTLEFSRVQKQGEGDSAGYLYGISVRKYIKDVLTEEGQSGFITEDAAFADSLLATLAANTVTPIVLNEILDELLY